MTTQKQIYFRPRRLGHVNLWTGNLQRSEKFYNQVCGLRVEFTEPGLMASFLGTGHTPHDIGLIEQTSGEARLGRDGSVVLPPGIGLKPGLNHVAWEVENEAELVAAYRRLVSDGRGTQMTVDHQIARSVYVLDPDGNSVEFYCDTVKDWRNVLHGEMDLITSHWDPLASEPSTDAKYDDDPVLKTEPDAPVSPYRLTHMVLETSRLTEMVDFYSTIAGLNVKEQLNDGGVVLLGGSRNDYEFHIALCSAEISRYHHAAFEMLDEATLRNAEANLEEKGIKSLALIDEPWKRSIYLLDDDGLATEFYARRAAPRGTPTMPIYPMSVYI